MHLAGKRSRWKNYLPISPAVPFEEDDQDILYMAGPELSKPSYVKFKESFLVRLNLLKPYARKRPGTYRLTSESLFLMELKMKMNLMNENVSKLLTHRNQVA